MRIIIKEATGMNVNNVPTEIIRLMNTYPVIADDGFSFTIQRTDLDRVKAILINFAASALRVSLSFDVYSDYMVCDNVTTGETARDEGPREEDVIGGYDPDGENDPDGSEVGEEDEREATIIAASPFAIVELGREQIASTIAACMDNNLASTAKNLNDKLAELNRAMLKTITLKREVAEMTSMVSADPIVNSLTSQANELTMENNLIERIAFTDNSVVIFTKRLITDTVVNGSRRDVGKMAVVVPLNCLVSKTIRDNSQIKILNLSHQYRKHGQNWQCGHVRDGYVCWGSAVEALTDALANRDLAYLSETIIRFIRNPDPNDAWGQYIRYFPIAGGTE